MNNQDVISLEGPFKHHLYIGYAPANKNAVLNLQKRLQEQEVICCLRASKDSVQASIQEGVGTSRKCLLFLTSDYLKDDWYQTETLAVIEKSKDFSHDAVIILKSEDLEEVIPAGLHNFTTHQYKPEKLNDKTFMASLVEMITQELYMNLTVLTKLNNGYGSARNYFYGYLRLVLADFKKRLLEETLKNDKDMVQKTVHRMLIIIPESCFCPTKLDSPNQIEFTEKYVVAVAHRAGNNKRDFKNSLYKLIVDAEKKQEYYFVAEFATPLLTAYDAYMQGICGMTEEQLYAERDAFYHMLKSILSHRGNAKCNDQFRLLYWPDPETKKPNQLDLYKFLLPELRKEIELQQRERNTPELETANNAVLLPPSSLHLNTFEVVPVHGCNPGRVFEDDVVRNYPMDRRPRGTCLIINIANFDNTYLSRREGAEKDEDVLTKLFTDRHFLVEVHRDINAQTLRTLLLEKQNEDHTNYDAFICCILSHGKLGVIYTSDGSEVEILSLVEFFTEKNCPSLEGKPKMFFIQACQTGDPEPESGAAGNTLPHDDSTGDHLAFPLSQNTVSGSAASIESFLPLTNGELIECVSDQISSIAGLEVEFKEDATPVTTVSTLEETLPSTVRHKAGLIPGHPDFLMSYSTLPGAVSYRNIETGSLYVQALNEWLRKDMEIDRVLKKVSSSVEEKLIQQGEDDGDRDRFQLPFHLTSGMCRSIYL